VRYVLFHELLHAIHPPRRDENRRWIHHGREFRRRERAYPGYAVAIEWEKRHIPALIRSARRGEALETPRPKRTAKREGLARTLQRLLFPV
jgi:hypothetical protein